MSVAVAEKSAAGKIRQQSMTKGRPPGRRNEIGLSVRYSGQGVATIKRSTMDAHSDASATGSAKSPSTKLAGPSAAGSEISTRYPRAASFDAIATLWLSSITEVCGL